MSTARIAAGRRLPQGGLVDRSRTLRFRFDGRTLAGHPGDTLASALVANGVDIVGRSFKYHRPRGLFGTGLEDPNSMLAVRDAHGYDPALRAGQVRLVEGLDVRTVAGWPSVRCDFGAVAQLAAGVMGAGFYYKTFKWPGWRLFEPLVRRATGFGQPRRDAGIRPVEHRHVACDVLVVGAGPAGLAAARALRGTGLSVVVADDQPDPGGSCRWEEGRIDGLPAAAWSEQVAAALAAEPGFTMLPSTLVTGAYENNFFTLAQEVRDEGGVVGERHIKLLARHVVLATGMIDRPMLFEANDRPGIMLSSAVRRLVGEFGVAPATRLAIYTNNDSAYLTAIAAHRAGIPVAAVVDTRTRDGAIHAGEVEQLGIPCHFDSEITGTSGYRRLAAVTVRGSGGARHVIACDGLAVSGGWTPTIHLAAHRGARPVYDPAAGMFLCRDLPDGWFVAGGAAGAPDLEATLSQAQRAALAIAAAHGLTPRLQRPCADARSYGKAAPAVLPRRGKLSRIWVDLQNDVKASDIALACRENYVSVEHLKRYTTLGMGTDQGRTSNVNGLAVLAALGGREIGEVGTTTFRPPYSAVRMGTIAAARQGDLYQPRRQLPAAAAHREHGAVMKDFGWERPDWYRANGASREAAVAAEMAAVRGGVGVFDASPLGKIEVTGPDAAQFLARFYVSDLTTLKPGRIRYSVMLRDDGTILDDGVVACIAADHFLACPTSGNADAVLAWFERWRQTEWPTMRVALAVATSNWATFALAGPHARRLLARLQPDFDIGADAFPHMAWRAGTLGGVPARVARVSFTGELQYEISVQARYGASLLKALLAPGDGLSPCPVGIQAWLRLRLEKGYMHVGSETNGRTTPLDLGMAGLVAKRADDFIGKRALGLPFPASAGREQLVGLVARDGKLETGGRILAAGHRAPPCPTDGYVTSACYSPTLDQWIGLALLERGRERHDETVTVLCDKRTIHCRVGPPVFLDPQNERLSV